MNNDDDRISPHPSSDHALEARIVAWVMGEASEFEIAELTRIIAEKPALAAFKTRIETTHRLLRQAAGPDKEPLRLSDERRAKLFAALGLPADLTAGDESLRRIASDETVASGPAPSLPAKSKPQERSSVLIYPMARPRQNSGAWFRGLSIACSLMLTFAILHVTVFAPKPHEEREQALLKSADRKSHVVLMAKKRLDASEQPEKMPSEVSAKEEISVQLPAMAAADNEQFKSATRRSSEMNDRDDAPPTWDYYNKLKSQPVFDVQLAGSGKDIIKTDKMSKEARDVSLGSTRTGFYTPPGTASTVARHYVAAGQTSLPSDSFSATPVNHEPISLAPFEVSETQDADYAATSTLAGTRLNTSTANLSVGSILPKGVLFGSGAPDGIIKSTARDLDSDHSTWGRYEGSTLAGNRVRTDLPDASSAISVVPNAFLGDPPSDDDASRIDLSANAESKASRGASPEAPAMQLQEARTDALSEKDAPAVSPVAAKPAAPARPDSTEDQSAQTNPVSTFSLHVSDVSFRLAADSLASGEKPDPASIRPEEFYNAFDYGDPAPTKGEAVSCRVEQSAHPTKQQRNLLRIAMRVPSTGRAATQPLHLTILLDTSGSMQRRDRAASVKDAMVSLISLLKPNDQITLIGFARTPHLLAESASGEDAKRLISIVKNTPAEGGTNLDAALALASELAERHQTSDALNRIVLITDGAANLGDADPKELSAKIEALRQKGIAFDACGVGTAGVDDAMLESLTRHGDGRYLLLDRASASAEFAKQLAGAFRPAAKNVKVQVRFNPNRVAHYRLLGFAQHRLKEEDFRNDKVDAAELAADEAANALYEVEPLPQGEGALGEVFVRFQDVANGQMVERSWTLPYDPTAARFDHASPSLQLAGTAALVAEYLQGEPINLDDLVGPVNQLRDHYRNESRVQILINMFDQLRRIDRRH